METKKLFVINVNCGDGSSCVHYTFNEEYINSLEEKYNNDDPDFDYEAYSDGDGFHYDILTVPVECTLESLGIRYDFATR